MPNRPLRRAQLISPFGPGAMVVAPDGSSLLAAGLDHWFAQPSSTRAIAVDPTEFQIRERRLESALDVDYFLLPPDYRRTPGVSWSGSQTNEELTVPFLRFPKWHVCPKCDLLREIALHLGDRPKCPNCDAQASRGGARGVPRMVQTRFIAVCERGHLQDFPWREWVHQTLAPTCQQDLWLYGTGGVSLGSTFVKCGCGATRSLERVTEFLPRDEATEEEDGEFEAARPTFLSANLAENSYFSCRGARPWLGDEIGEGCDRPLLGTLRGATNVYFSDTRSAIMLPTVTDSLPAGLMDVMQGAQIQGTLRMLKLMDHVPTPELLRASHGVILSRFSDEEIATALDALESGEVKDSHQKVGGDDDETSFRRAEHGALTSFLTSEHLVTRPQDLEKYDSHVRRHIELISLIPKLRETRALSGFSRIYPSTIESSESRNRLLWREPPREPNRWLPAYQVSGEGIFLELDRRKLSEWERQDSIRARVSRLSDRHAAVRAKRHLPPLAITPRFVLAHTIAHLLINQLVFTCGYSSASLRERLYISDSSEAPMAGILIYTAAGDSEGTLGGLVRMGKSPNLEAVFREAIIGATWCSSDPVCMELGASGGQGPDSCNLAACHGCALLPETSCEQFNQLLDRWLVVGAPDDPSPGYFSSLVDSA